MKQLITLSTCALIFIGLFSCGSAQKKDATSQDTTEIKETERSISGIVQSIENGKDGYTAVVKTANNELYTVLISIPNLGKNNQYRRFKVNEEIAVKGEYWTLGDEKRITVREILNLF